MKQPRTIKIGNLEVHDPDDPASRARLVHLTGSEAAADKLLNDTRKLLKRAAKKES